MLPVRPQYAPAGTSTSKAPSKARSGQLHNGANAREAVLCSPDILDMEQAAELRRQYELSERGRLAAEKRIDELQANEEEYQTKIGFLGVKVRELKDGRDDYAQSTRTASLPRSTAASTHSLSSSAPDPWTSAPQTLDIGSTNDTRSLAGTIDDLHRDVDQARKSSEIQSTQRLLMAQQIRNLKSELKRKDRLQHQSQQDIERLEKHVRELKTENTELTCKMYDQELSNSSLQKWLTANGMMALPGSPRRRRSATYPRRPAFDPTVPGGVPDWATRCHLYQDGNDNTRETILKVLLLQSALCLQASPPCLAKLLVTAVAASQHALSLNNMALLGRCAYYRGRAEFALEDFDGAIQSFREARSCKGRYMEGEGLSRWIKRAKARIDRGPTTIVDESLSPNGQPSPGMTADERDNIRRSMKRWTTAILSILDTEHWLRVLRDPAQAQRFANDIELAVRASNLQDVRDTTNVLEPDSPGNVLRGANESRPPPPGIHLGKSKAAQMPRTSAPVKPSPVELHRPSSLPVSERTTSSQDTSADDIFTDASTYIHPVGITRKHKPVPINIANPQGGLSQWRPRASDDKQQAEGSEGPDSAATQIYVPRTARYKPAGQDLERVPSTAQPTMTPAQIGLALSSAQRDKPLHEIEAVGNANTTAIPLEHIQESTISPDQNKKQSPPHPAFTMEMLRSDPIVYDHSNAKLLWGKAPAPPSVDHSSASSMASLSVVGEDSSSGYQTSPESAPGYKTSPDSLPGYETSPDSTLDLRPAYAVSPHSPQMPGMSTGVLTSSGSPGSSGSSHHAYAESSYDATRSSKYTRDMIKGHVPGKSAPDRTVDISSSPPIGYETQSDDDQHLSQHHLRNDPPPPYAHRHRTHSPDSLSDTSRDGKLPEQPLHPVLAAPVQYYPLHPTLAPIHRLPVTYAHQHPPLAIHATETHLGEPEPECQTLTPSA